MSNDLNLYTTRVETASTTIHSEADRVKSLTNELATVIDSERKVNYERTREIDNREIAVIGREKLVDMKYKSK